MKKKSFYTHLINAITSGHKGLAILLDPDKINTVNGNDFLCKIPECDYFYVGGSKVDDGKTHELVKILKQHTQLPIILFPGDINQITPEADSLLYLSLMSGNNPEYLIGQQKIIWVVKVSPWIVQPLILDLFNSLFFITVGRKKV